MDRANAMALAVLSEIVTLAPSFIAALIVDVGKVDPSKGPLLERLALGGLVSAARDVLPALGIETDPAELLSAERLNAAGVNWEAFPDFDRAAADRLLQLQETL